MDLFVYGCPRVLRYMSLVKQNAVCYHMSDILQELHVTQAEFRDICVVAGTDYGGGSGSGNGSGNGNGNGNGNENDNGNNDITIETVWDLFQVYASACHRTQTFHEWLVANENSTTVPHMDLLRLRKVTSMFDCTYPNHIQQPQQTQRQHPQQPLSITVTS